MTANQETDSIDKNENRKIVIKVNEGTAFRIRKGTE